MIAMEKEHSRSLGMKILFCLFLLLVEMSCCGEASSRAISMETQTFDVQKYLNSFNKAPLMSIQSPDGDTIDCVHISKQPAFDHPLLKNHSIQMRPNYHPGGGEEGDLFVDKKLSKGKNSSTSVGKNRGSNGNNSGVGHQLWHKNGRCPEGTIPIRRTTKEDLLRANSVERFGKKRLKTIPLPKSVNPDINTQNGHQHAIGYVQGDKYYGAKATINVWQPQIQQPNEFSLSQIWILGGSFDSDLNSVEAGWQVSPDLYGDSNTRLFTYWTSDAYQATGCYNLLCSGFIQISSDIAMGASIRPLSTYSGSQYDVSVLVWKDPKEGNWWMQYGNDHVVGYWPASLFSYLVDSATMIEWGGEVVNAESDGLHTTTQMGSGHFPGEGFGKASYFKNIQIVDGSNRLRDPDGLNTFTEQPDCYDVNIQDGGGWGKHFYYGGPGRNVNCP